MDIEIETILDEDVEARIHRALEECKKGGWVRNPFVGAFGDFAPVCIEMADGTCRWETIDMRRRDSDTRPGTPPDDPTEYEAS